MGVCVGGGGEALEGEEGGRGFSSVKLSAQS